MSLLRERQLFYLLLILGAGFFMHLANSVPTLIKVPGDPGPGYLPFWISALIILLVGFLLVKETLLPRLHGRQAQQTLPSGFSRQEVAALAMTLTAIVLYLILLGTAGFFIASLIFLCAFRLIADLVILARRPSRHSLITALIFAITSTSLIYLVFSVIFKLALP